MNYFKLDVMSATSKVTEGLKMRGFFVEEVNGAIMFKKESAQSDQDEALQILNCLGIPYIVLKDSSVEILVNNLPISILNKIQMFGGTPFKVNFEERHAAWRYFTTKRFGIRVNALELEYNMSRFVKAANLAGIQTLAGCNGHLKHSPRFQLSGVFNGAWLKVVQEKYMSDLQLNYQWEVMYQGVTQAEFRAIGNAEWKQSLIHQDTLKMADVFEKHAEEIREMKKRSFSKHQLEPKRYAQQTQYEQLEMWMYKQVQ